MPCITYKHTRFQSATQEIIEQANEIIEEYAEQGYDLTLRQLYYQFVSRGLVPNKDKEYMKLSRIVSKARLAGLINWNSIVDRLRPSQGNSHWNSPKEILESCAGQYRLDTREDQDTYLEVWVEKDALSDIVGRICKILDVPYLVCRGFVSQSAMWTAAQRLQNKEREGKKCVILHLGDHDPSGVDMTRDIQDRLRMFRSDTHVLRIALLMKQIKKYNPPPDPAKVTDSRYEKYRQTYGDESWELDALEPNVITELIMNTVVAATDTKKLQKRERLQKTHRNTLQRISENWEEFS